MSFLLTLVVAAAFFTIAIKRPKGSGSPSAEVLFGALTLFSAILAGRIELPDRSTLRGLLSATGNWLIVASILPTVLLAVALAFLGSSPSWAVVAAGIAMAVQLVLQLVMWRGPLSDTGSSRRPPRRLLRTGPAPDYARAHVLSSDWWRSTTAEALMIGRQAYGYVVWQHGDRPSLSRLLVDAQQASPPIEATRPGTRRLVDAVLSQLSHERRSAAASRPPPAGDAGNFTTPLVGDGLRHGVPPARGPAANILAVLRSGTAAQALTFIVFREQPTEAWRQGLRARQVELDPDRLAPLEQFVNTIVIYIGVTRGVDFPPLGGHPLLTTLLGAIAMHHLITAEIQLPVPAPYGACPDRHWARVRIGLRDTDIGYLAPFLDSIRAGTETHPDWDVRVQVVPDGGPRAIAAIKSAVPAGEARVVLASEMDVVTSRESSQSSGDHGRDWRVLALCANARGNRKRCGGMAAHATTQAAPSRGDLCDPARQISHPGARAPAGGTR